MLQYSTKALEHAASLTVYDPSQALAIANDHLRSDPLDSDAIFIKYNALKNLGRWKEALNTASQLGNVSSDKSLSHLYKADMLYHLGQYNEAIETAQQAIADDDDKSLGSIPYRLISLCHAIQGNELKAVAAAKDIPETEENEWFPPVGAIPAGTKAQYTAIISRMADHVASGREFTPPKRKIFQ